MSPLLRDQDRGQDQDQDHPPRSPITHHRPKGGVIGDLIEASARNPLISLMAVSLLIVWAIYALRAAPLDAIPDLSDTQVIIFTDWKGRSPDLVEDQVTYPISSALMGSPKVSSVRGQSFFGLSFVHVIFEEGVDLYWARSRVLESLNSVSTQLPTDAKSRLGPDATGVGWVFMYVLVDHSGQLDLQELRTLQDWNIRYALQGVSGVAEVASIGGFEKQYQVLLDPNRLYAHKVSIEEVKQAIKESNQESGGRVIEVAGHEHMIRGRGYLEGISDLEMIPIRVNSEGVAILVRDVATVSIGPELRRGIAEWNGQGEAVGGIIVMRSGENTLKVIKGVKERLREVRKSLPPGVKIEVAYDRSELIKSSIKTLTDTLVEEMLVVSLIIFLFLLHIRSALVPIITIPIAILLSFIPIFAQGITMNIMSLGGIAIAIGAMVDASIIIVENTHKRLEESRDTRSRDTGGRDTGSLATSSTAHLNIVIDAMREVGPSIFFSLLVITVSFIPVFTLEATEGRLFKPLAFTKTYSMGFAAILAITLTPALTALFIRGQVSRERDHLLSRLLQWIYRPIVRWVIRFRYLVILITLSVMVWTFGVYQKLQSEFMPPLNEGSLLYMPSAPPGMSITEASRVLQTMNRQIKRLPEVVSVFGKMGRAQTATDPAPLGMVETTIMLKPKSEWREGLTWDGLIAELDAQLQYPGMPNIWWMPIQTRIEMLSTGVRSPLAIQVFGDDLKKIEHTSIELEEALRDLPGTRSVFAERSTGGFFLDIEVDREAASRYGLRVAQIQEVVRTAIGGVNVTEMIEGRRRFSVNVRYAREFRDDPERLEQILVKTANGAQIPLAQVAELRFISGPPMMRSEDGQLLGFVFIDLERQDISISDYVAVAKKRISERVSLSSGVRLQWAGQFRYLERAEEKLRVILPFTLALIFFLIYLNTRSVIETLIVLFAVPCSLIGAIWLIYALDYHMSVAVWVGLIALAGLDAETGVVMLLYLKLSTQRAQDRGELKSFNDLSEAIVEGAAGRIRPKLMTVMTTMIGLSPILWSTGAGADVMKRIAAPMVGGLVTSFLLELTVYPAIFSIWKRGVITRVHTPKP